MVRGEPLEAWIWVPFLSVSNVFLGKLVKSASLSLLVCTMGIIIVSASEGCWENCRSKAGKN